MISFIQRAAMLAILFCLSGCASVDTQRFQTDPSAPQTAQNVRTIYENRTFITHGPHGTQVEFHNANGISHLWYPGNTAGVPARWQVQARSTTDHSICWRYPSRSYNPLTRQSGGSLECSSAALYFPSVTQIVQGDPFNLDSGQIPFRMARAQYSAQDLAARAGIDPRSLQIIYAEY